MTIKRVPSTWRGKMKELPVKTVEELEIEVEKIRKQLEEKKTEFTEPSKPLFRGQSNADDWELKTTLERYTTGPFSVERYNALMNIISPVITSFTGKEWKADNFSDYMKEVENNFYFRKPPSLELMVYARHHGFPSPLLDWTQSLYVALFFAFRHATNKNVAIFVYVETIDGGKGGWAADPEICLISPYINTHKRHYSQQAQYTVAVKKDVDSYRYYPHESVFRNPVPDQDMLYKFILPSSIKEDVLNKLFEMNINAFTLYSNEEALMEMLAFKELNNVL
jgi:hypothetical protein